jgi:hypothetical protein
VNIKAKMAAVIAGVALAATPAAALASHPSGSTSSKARQYGKLCQAESKQHVKGMKGTPFSQCVTAMAKLANGSKKKPSAACKAETKKHVKGTKGTPFSQCIAAGAKLLKEEKK